MTIDVMIAKRLLDLANIVDPPVRKRKLDNITCVQEIMYVLRTGVQWSKLRSLSNTHWTTVYKRFRKWCQKDVFGKLWDDCVAEYVTKKGVDVIEPFRTLFIDSTMIKNVSGEDGTGRNPSDRGRQATKMSIICDENQVPLSCTFYPANQSDCTTIEQSVDALKVRPVATTLVGDKGYISRVRAEKLAEETMYVLGSRIWPPDEIWNASISFFEQLSK
jgi:transposase